MSQDVSLNNEILRTSERYGGTAMNYSKTCIYNAAFYANVPRLSKVVTPVSFERFPPNMKSDE